MDTVDDILRRFIAEEVARQLDARAPAPATAAGAVLPLDPGQLLSVARAAGRLGTSTDYIYDRINAGELPVVELGGSRSKQRVRLADLETFVSKRRFSASRRRDLGGSLELDP